jgi:filamentous hemagglutinin
MLVIALVVLLGFAALAVDLSNLYATQAELASAAAAAATAGAIELPDESGAATIAIQFAELNMSPGTHGSVLAAADVETGFWNTTSRTFIVGGTPVNAVRVTTRRASANGNPVGPMFGWILGSSGHDLHASATAMLLPLLPGGLASTGDISLSGNVTIDSYHSTEGAYDPGTAGDNGDVATNGSVSITGNVTVNGDVTGGNVSSGGGGTVTGDMAEPRRPISLPPVDTSGVESDNDNDQLPPIQQGNRLVSPLDADRNFSLSSNTDYDMPPGTYYFNDLSLSGQATLNLSGLTVIYLTGDLDTSGGNVVNATEDPKNLVIFMTGGTATVNASIDWYGVIYAPETDIQFNGNADAYGAIVGGTIDGSGGADLHYDEDVSTVLEGMIELPKRSALVD